MLPHARRQSVAALKSSRDIKSTLTMTATRTPPTNALAPAFVFARNLQTNAAKVSCASKNATPASIIVRTISLSRSDAWLAAAAGIHQCRDTNSPNEVNETLTSRIAKTLPGWSRTSKAMTCGWKMQPTVSSEAHGNPS